MNLQHLLQSLGIPDDYGLHPPLPRYADATDLETVVYGIYDRPQQLASQTAADWAAMRLAAAQDGVELQIVSGFRSVARQAELLRRKLAAGQAIRAILEVNAAPGYSQHHTGKAADIATPGILPLSEDFSSSLAFGWLEEHAAGFGFCMPYGRDNPFGFVFEPWHWSQLTT